jgi:hypothetical protein
MEKMGKAFEEIEDTRHQSYVEHKLSHVLILVMFAVLSGITELELKVSYFKSKKQIRKEKFNIEETPSKSTLSRILNMVDSEKIGGIAVKLMQENTQEISNIVAIDGKTICGTIRKGEPHTGLQVLTAYVTGSGVVLGQKSIIDEEKTNEIPKMRELLEEIDIEGKTITADAMHCQTETCGKIIEKHGHYCFGVKGNQPNLESDVKLYFDTEIPTKSLPKFETLEKNG